MREEIGNNTLSPGSGAQVLSAPPGILTPGFVYGAEGNSSGRRLSILVAEADPCDALLLDQAFLKAGLQLVTQFVDDGQELISYLQGEPPFADRHLYPMPTMLVLDLMLPNLDGFEVLDWLRRQPQLARMLVVVLSASEDPAHIEGAYSLGADSYLVKPADCGELIEVAHYLKSLWVKNHGFVAGLL